MKKVLSLIVLFLFFVIPVNAYAIKIDSVNITGDKEKNPKEDVTLTFHVNFKDIEKGLDKTQGIWYIEFELVYDEKVFQVKDVSSKDFEVELLESAGKYYIFGQVIDNEDSDNYCAEGMLYCSDYTVDVKFSMKDTKKDSSTIQMTNVEVGLLDMVEAKEYTEDDVMLITHPNSATHTITINQPKSTNSNSNKNTSTQESRNLSSLEIEGYSLEFDKEETDYEVYVKEGTNSIIINATTEDPKATFEVIGADDLRKNGHQVKIVVTATDKTKKTYYLKVKEKKEESEEIKKPLKTKRKAKKSVDPEVIKKWAGIGVGILFVILLIMFIVSKIKDHAIDKKLKKLDE